MLQNIRDQAHGWVFGILVALLIIPFALWGINSYFSTSSNVAVAEVNGSEIGRGQLQRAFQRYRQQLILMAGGAVNVNKLDQQRIKREALEQLVDHELLRRTARESGMRISNEQVSETITSMDQFKKDGMFDNAIYEQVLKLNGDTPTQYEDNLRATLLNEQFRQGLAVSEFTTQVELERVNQLRHQKRKIAYLALPVESYKTKIQVTEQDIETYYKGHQNEYKDPESVKTDYLILSIDDLAKQIEAGSEEELLQHYDDRRADYSLAEERGVKHILVKLSEGAGDKQLSAAQAKAKTYADLGRKGTAFEAIAETHFDQADTQSEFGDLGFIQKGVMDPAFDAAVFKMAKGEISEPVRTKFGFHVIQVNEIKPGGTRPFAEVRDEIEQSYRREQAESHFFEQADRLADLTFENPDSLQEASEVLEIPIQTSNYFSRKGGKGITADSKVIAAAFSNQVLEEGTNSEPIELDETRVVVLRVADRKPASVRALSEVRDAIRKTLVEQEAKKKTRELGESLLTRLKDGEDYSALASEQKLAWEHTESVKRDDPEVNRAILRHAFKMGWPGSGKPMYGGFQSGTGDYTLVAVLGVEAPKADAIDEKARKEIRDELVRKRGGQSWFDFVAQLRARADIEIYDDSL